MASFNGRVRQVFCIHSLGTNLTVITVIVITLTSRVGECIHFSCLELSARVISTFMLAVQNPG